MTLFQGCLLSFLIKISLLYQLYNCCMCWMQSLETFNHHKKVLKLFQYKKDLSKALLSTSIRFTEKLCRHLNGDNNLFSLFFTFAIPIIISMEDG